MKRIPVIIFLISIFTIGFIQTSCDENTLNPGDHIEFPESDISYRDHVTPFIRVQCSYAGCHDRLNQNYQYDLIGYGNWYLNYPNLFVADNPDASRFYQIVSMDAQYPTHYPVFPINQFTENEVDGIRTWIMEGIKDN